MGLLKKYTKRSIHIGYLPARYIPTCGKYICTAESEIVAKILIPGSDNGFYSINPRKNLCKCLHRLKREINNRYRVPRNKSVIYRTADGYDIVCEAFKLFCEENGYAGVRFMPLPKSPGWYLMELDENYSVDWGRGYTFHGEFCRKCGNVSYYYPYPMFRSPDCTELGDDFIARTDIEYGDFNCAPLLVIGLATAKKMLEKGFKGIYFEPVYSCGGCV